MQVNLLDITKNWQAFEADASITYLIQNRGYDVLVALEADSLPNATDEGVMVEPYQVVEYKKGSQNLYLRAFNQSCSVNVSIKEE